MTMIEYLVIGGGIAGLSAGAALSPLGKVLLVEGEASLGYHTSGRSAALYEAEYGAPATVALARASRAPLEAMGALSPRGIMVVAMADQQDQFLRDVAEMNLREITVAEARAMVPILNPDVVAHAAHTDSARNIDTDLVMQTFAREIRAAGGEIRTSAPVTAIQRLPVGWAVTAGGETLYARYLVNAAGAWADRVAEMAGRKGIGLQPMRRSMAQLPPPGGHDIRAWPMVYGAGETWYAKPEAGKLLVSPAEEDPCDPHDAWADDMVLAEGLARYEAFVTEPVTRLETSWAGLRSFAPDRALVLGKDPLDPSLIWCAGQGGQGFLSSPGVYMALREMCGGAASGLDADILAGVSVARLRRDDLI
jgi:D-arginine dehydrogenase